MNLLFARVYFLMFCSQVSALLYAPTVRAAEYYAPSTVDSASTFATNAASQVLAGLVTAALMQPVRLHDAGEIAAPWAQTEIDAPVHEYIVKEKIDETIAENAEPCGERERGSVCAEIHQDHGWNGEDDGEPVVFFEYAYTRFMMGAVEAPQPPMHHILMGCPCNDFHQQDEPGKYQNKQQRRHFVSVNFFPSDY